MSPPRTAFRAPACGPYGARRVLILRQATAFAVALILGFGAWLAPEGAQADGKLGHRVVHDARRGLAQYDLTGPGSTRFIASLGEAIGQIEHASDRREARFLRTMAAADLIILAALRDDEGLHDRVARAWGTEPDRLPRAVAGELKRLRVGVYAGAAGDALDALERIGGGGGSAPSADPEAGLRSQTLFVGAVRRLIAAGDDPVEALAAMGTDPCAEGEDADGCTPVLLRFAEPGRRAAGVLQAAWRALEALERAGAQGDPFSAALGATLKTARGALAGAVLFPGPRLPDEPATVGAPATAQPLSAHLVILVHPGEVRYGWVPKVRLDGQGDLTLLTPGQPVLPDMARHRIPTDFRPAVQPIDALTAALQKAAPSPDGVRVALAADPGVPAHVVTRVLHSAVRAGLTPTMLVGPDPAGQVRGVPIQMRDTRQGAEGSPEVSVFVRLGGYTVRTRRGKVDVPRVRGEDGLRFDVDGLGQHVGKEPPASAAVEFMTVAAMGPVLEAVFRVAPAGGAVQLLVP
jgi:hypothetical protein